MRKRLKKPLHPKYKRIRIIFGFTILFFLSFSLLAEILFSQRQTKIAQYAQTLPLANISVTNPSPMPQNKYSLDLSVHLGGIGNGRGENSHPVTTQRTMIVQIHSPVISTVTGTLTFDPVNGNFINRNFNLGMLPAGSHQMVGHIDGYLDQQISHPDGSTTLLTLIPGDFGTGTHGDNFIDIIDYNFLAGCISKGPLGDCKIADLNDDAKIDQADIDLLIGHFGSLGFSFEEPEFTCTIDPSCQSGQNTVRLCTLVCTKQPNKL